MATSISVTEDTRNALQTLKMEEGYPSMEALIRDMLLWYKKQRLMEAGRTFRARMDRKGLTPQDLIE